MAETASEKWKVDYVAWRVPLVNRIVIFVVAEDPKDEHVRDVLTLACHGLGVEGEDNLWDTWCDTEFNPSVEGSGWVQTGGNLGNLILVWAQNDDPGLVAHELSHAATFILRSTEIGDNDEVRSLLVEEMMRTVGGRLYASLYEANKGRWRR